MARRVTGTFWPSGQQERLLVAALGDPLEAAAAWRSLPAGFSLDRVERGSFELLPLVYRNLAQSLPAEPPLPRLKGTYRKSWVANSLLGERMRDVAAALREGEIRALFVEGLALAERFYAEPALRPTSAIDILVADESRNSVLARLARAGWVARGAVPDGRPGPRYVSDEAGSVCVVRTTLAMDFVEGDRADGTYELLLRNAEPTTVLGEDVLVPTATDTLLAVCVIHARAAPSPAIQWLVDAKMIMRAEIDWDRLLATAVAHGQGTRLREAFAYLAGLPGPAPPEAVREELERRRPGSRERLVYACTSGRFRAAGNLAHLLAEHLASTGGQSALRTAAGFPAHLRDRWNLSSTWQLPFGVARRAVRLVGARVRGSA